MQDMHPTTVILETFSYCNAKCRFCAYPRMKRRKGVMSKVLLHKIVSEISSWNTPLEIVPTMYGEFFLNPDWKYYLKYISDNLPTVQISIPTNGSCFNDDVIDFIVSIPNVKYISFSAYTYVPSTYATLIGLPDQTRWVIYASVNRLKRDRPDINVRIGTTEDPEFIPYHGELSILQSRYGSIVDPHPIAKNTGLCGFTNPIEETRSCGSVFTTAVILNDGRVVACCFDPEAEIVLGDINNETLGNIWNGDIARDVRIKHGSGKRGEIPLCRSCNQVARTSHEMKGSLK